MSVRRLLPLALIGIWGCHDPGPSGVLLTVISAGRPPSAVELIWLDAQQVLFRRRAPQVGFLSAALAPRFTVFIGIKDPPLAGSRRVAVRGEIDGAPVSEGAAQIDHLEPGVTRVEITLQPGLLPDGDGDGIPDQIDRCPAQADPQGRCRAASDDAGAPEPPADAGVDAAEPDASDEPISDGPISPDAPMAADAPLPGVADASPARPDAPAAPDTPPPPPPSARFKVGTFTRTTGGAGTRQTVTHGLGAPPRALILWTSVRPDDGLGAAFFAIGVSDGPAGTSRSAAFASQDRVTASRASRRMSARALTVGLPDTSTAAEAELVDWDGNAFTLRWDPSGGAAYRIHYLLIGGEVSARVLAWQAPIANDAPFAVTGVGFRPQVVMHFHIGAGSGAPPSVVQGGLLGAGVMTAAGSQWADAVIVQTGIIPSNTARVERTDQALVLLGDDDTLTRQASFVSMDPDGFTMQFTGTSPATGQVFSLALAGVSAAAGSFSKSAAAAPADQPVAGVGFRPGLVLLASVNGPSQPGRQPSALFGLGASDGVTEACSAVSDVHALPTTSATSFDRSNRVFLGGDRRQVEAEADLAAVEADGFRLRWIANDALPVDLTYLTLAAP